MDFGDFFSRILNVSLFGWLDKIPLWQGLPYPTKGAILRGLKAVLSYLIGIAITIPLVGINPIMAALIAAVLQGLDKAIREWNIEKEASASNAEIPTSDNVSLPPGDTATPDVDTDATVVKPDPDTGEPVVDTDATTVDGQPVDPDAVPAADADPTVFDDPTTDGT